MAKGLRYRPDFGKFEGADFDFANNALRIFSGKTSAIKRF